MEYNLHSPRCFFDLFDGMSKEEIKREANIAKSLFKLLWKVPCPRYTASIGVDNEARKISIDFKCLERIYFAVSSQKRMDLSSVRISLIKVLCDFWLGLRRLGIRKYPFPKF